MLYFITNYIPFRSTVIDNFKNKRAWLLSFKNETETRKFKILDLIDMQNKYNYNSTRVDVLAKQDFIMILQFLSNYKNDIWTVK